MKRKIIGTIIYSLVLVIMIIPTAGMHNIGFRRDAKNAISFQLVTGTNESALFPYTVIAAGEGHVRLVLENSSIYYAQPGNPQIPKLVQHFELPFAVTNVQVSVLVPEWYEQSIPGVIIPTQKHLSYNLPYVAVTTDIQRNNDVYTSNQLYPSTWFNYHIGCGLNETLDRVTHVTLEVYPLRYRPADNTIVVAQSMSVEILYDPPEVYPLNRSDNYDLVIIAPSVFSSQITRLVEHKNNYGVATMFKSTEDIYAAYDGADPPEQIKYFIKNALETWNITYVLLIGGLKSLFYGSARDTTNDGSQDWYVPVRYSNLYDIYNTTVIEPGFLCDLYYSDIYKVGGVFDNWDSNNDGVFAARNKPGSQDDELDLYPDVYVGRLPCRNIKEVKTCVDKIIAYETTAAGSDWFYRIVAIAGDGLHDSDYLNIAWDVTDVPTGKYTISAKSRSNITGEWGPVDKVTVTINHEKKSSLHFSEDDVILDNYPGPAITEITSPSNGDILGSTDVDFTPSKAYMGDLWANVTYVDGVMHIRGKSYDPRPYGFYTDVVVWIENENGETVFTQQKNNVRCYADCEWTTGNQLLGGGRAGAFYYMPDSFKKIYLWASNGNFTSQTDVLNTLSEGCGFAFFFGHAGPDIMVVNMPGLPGGQGKSQVTGLRIINFGNPVFPMNNIKNGNKLPIVAVMGCHNSLYNVTLLNSIFGWNRRWTYSFPTPECWSEWLTRVPQGGAIATIGCTALGPGEFDENFAPDTGCWIFPELFRQYGQEGHRILGVVYGQTISSYLSTFGITNSIDQEMIQELALFGDPSLLIGGYP